MNKKYFNLKIIYISFLLISSISFNFYYGYLGVFPIDSFLIYNAGHNVLNGFHPFKDYWSITGPLLDYIQFIFFLLFDVNWFSYVLHAAIINFIITIFSFYFFIKMGLNISFSFIYSLCISILAYPLIGTPFVDIHAVIFSLISVSLMNLGIFYKKNNFFYYSAILIILSFFSKQIPSAYILLSQILILLFYIYACNKKNYKPLINYLMIIFLSFIFILVFFFINDIPIKNFIVQYILYPASIGSERTSELSFTFNKIIGQFKFIYLSLLPILGVILILLRKKIKNIEITRDLIILISTIIVSLIFIYCQMITRNQILIFFLIPYYLAISQIYTTKYWNRKSVLPIILILLLVSTAKYHQRFNNEKKFMDLDGYDINLVLNSKVIDSTLSGLKWISLDFIDEPDEEIKLIKNTKEFLLNDIENKIYITDYQFFQSITKNDNISPNKWYDALSIPSEKNKYFANYKLFFLESLKKQQIDNIYFISLERKEEIFINSVIDNKKCLNFEKINKILTKFIFKNCKI